MTWEYHPPQCSISMPAWKDQPGREVRHRSPLIAIVMTVVQRGLRGKVREKHNGTNNATALGKVRGVGALAVGIETASAIAVREARAMIVAAAVDPIIEGDPVRIGRIAMKDLAAKFQTVAVMNGLRWLSRRIVRP